MGMQMRQLLLKKKKRELSEYKAIYMIKDYFLFLFQAIQKNTQELSKVFLRLFNLLQHNIKNSTSRFWFVGMKAIFLNRLRSIIFYGNGTITALVKHTN
ncbi:transposase [Bacillus anthracis]|nr:transposase [Bacillus anthracis]